MMMTMMISDVAITAVEVVIITTMIDGEIASEQKLMMTIGTSTTEARRRYQDRNGIGDCSTGAYLNRRGLESDARA